MFLRVNPRVGVWGVTSQDKSVKLWFSFADPRPHKINVDELPGEVQKALQGAIRTNILIEVDKKGEPKHKEKTSPLGLSNNRAVDKNTELKAKELLKQGVTSIRREVALVKDPLVLSAAVALERDGKNRKTVVKLLDKQLEKTPIPPQHIRPRGLGLGAKSLYDNLIEEEEGEEIVFNTSAIDIVEEAVSDEDLQDPEEG